MPALSPTEGLKNVPIVGSGLAFQQNENPEHRFYHMLAVCLLVVCSISPSHSAAQTQQPSTMVIDGGTASKAIKL